MTLIFVFKLKWSILYNVKLYFIRRVWIKMSVWMNDSENELLCRAWIKISDDPIKGCGQNTSTFWEAITAYEARNWCTVLLDVLFCESQDGSCYVVVFIRRVKDEGTEVRQSGSPLGYVSLLSYLMRFRIIIRRFLYSNSVYQLGIFTADTDFWNSALSSTLKKIQSQYQTQCSGWNGLRATFK